MTIGSTLIISCWAVILLVWTVTSLTAKHTAKRQNILKDIPYALLMGLSVWLLIEGVAGKGILIANILPHSTLITFLGVAITFAGMVLTVWARFTLGGNWSASVVVKKKHELVIKGPYAFIRHPIYAGMLTMFIGTAIAAGHLASFLAVPILFLSCWIKLRQEESLMVQEFGAKYTDYQKKVKALIPHIY
jgi:protein-S-isoprenylcysteine O-methyltransferase Ste14